MTRQTQVSIKPMVLKYICSRGEAVHVEDVVYELGKRISVNQAVRIYRSYHRTTPIDEIDLTYAARWARRRQIRVCVRELTREGRLEEVSDGYYEFRCHTRPKVDRKATGQGASSRKSEAQR